MTGDRQNVEERERVRVQATAYASPSVSPPTHHLPSAGFPSKDPAVPDPSKLEGEPMDQDARRSPSPSSSSALDLRGEPASDILNKVQGAFIPKLFSMVSSDWLDELIAWSADGATFSVFSPVEFSKTVLPQFFKHQVFQSFVRQLNIYGFRKVHKVVTGPCKVNTAEGPWEFMHESFLQGRPDLLVNIKRKSKGGVATVMPSPAPSVASPRTSKKRSASESGSSSNSTSSSMDLDIQQGLDLGSSTISSGGNREQLSAPSGPSQRARSAAPGSGRLSPSALSRIASPDSSSQWDAHTARPTSKSHPPHAHDMHRRGHSLRDSLPHDSPPLQAYSTRSPPLLSFSPLSPRPQFAPGAPGAPGGLGADPVALANHLASLDAQVRSLSETLHHRQQSAAVEREATTNALRMLLEVVGGLDIPGDRREELEEAFLSLSREPNTSSCPDFSRKDEVRTRPITAPQPTSTSAHQHWDGRSSRPYPRPPLSTHRFPVPPRIAPSTESWTRGGRRDSATATELASMSDFAFGKSASRSEQDGSPTELRTSLPSLKDLLMDDAEGGLGLGKR